MVSDRGLARREWRLPAAGLTAWLLCASLLTGCSWLMPKPAPEPVTQAPEASEPVRGDTVEPPQSAVDAALVGDTTGTAGTPAAQSSTPARDSSILAPNAPSSYTVKTGDTLWDIATLFLRDPWLWPEIWYVNPGVQNPHLIYPGDVLALAYGADGSPQIRLERGSALRVQPLVRSSPLDGAIATIPYSAIAAFLSRPSVVAREDAKKAPRVLALRDDHVVAGAGHVIYIRGLPQEAAARYNVVQLGDELRDPDDGDVLGYLGVYSATAQISEPGKTGTAVLRDSERETLEGDLLFADDVQATGDIIPRAPTSRVDGEIISVIDGVNLIGQYQVVAINRGNRHGLEPGHVLTVDDAGDVVRDRCRPRSGPARCWFGPGEKVRLPDERAGTLLVFKTYERMSYGLVVSAVAPIRVTDKVHSPD